MIAKLGHVSRRDIGNGGGGAHLDKAPEIFSLSPRGTSGERGIQSKWPPLPIPLLLWGGEGEHQLRPGGGGIDAPTRRLRAPITSDQGRKRAKESVLQRSSGLRSDMPGMFISSFLGPLLPSNRCRVRG